MRLQGKGLGSWARPETKQVTPDFDATLVDVHADDKEGAEPSYKKGCGFHALLSCCDQTREAFAASCNRARVVPTPQPTVSNCWRHRDGKPPPPRPKLVPGKRPGRAFERHGAPDFATLSCPYARSKFTVTPAA